jgi:hypothetical protein
MDYAALVVICGNQPEGEMGAKWIATLKVAFEMEMGRSFDAAHPLAAL